MYKVSIISLAICLFEIFFCLFTLYMLKNTENQRLKGNYNLGNLNIILQISLNLMVASIKADDGFNSEPLLFIFTSVSLGYFLVLNGRFYKILAKES